MAQARSYDLIVIGSGAAGGVAAQLAAQAGKKVALIEAVRPGGSTPNFNDLPSKALLTAANAYQSARQAKRYGIRIASAAYNFPSIWSWKEKVIAETGVRDANEAYAHEHIEYISGRAQFINKDTVVVHDTPLTAKRFLIATGAADLMPDIPGLIETGFITSREAMELKSPPKSMAIIGAGATGVEMAEIFGSFGTSITLIEKAERILPKEDGDVSELLERVFKQRDIDVITDAHIASVETATRKKKKLTIGRNGQNTHLLVDEILVCAGRRPVTNLGLAEAGVSYNSHAIKTNNTLQTSNRRIYAAGDVTGHGHYTHISTTQGRIAAHNMFERTKVVANYNVIPRTIYAWPEIAAVGATTEELKAKNIHFSIVTLPISVVARSIISGDDVGFVKMLAKADGHILGASIMAPRATDMIAEITLAMAHKITVQQIANTVHPFPSWSDAVRVACSQF